MQKVIINQLLRFAVNRNIPVDIEEMFKSREGKYSCQRLPMCSKNKCEMQMCVSLGNHFME